MEDKKVASKAPTEYEESSDQQSKAAERRKKYALILANRDKLKQVFKMYGSIENGEETMSIVEYINMASSFNLTPKIISFSNLRKLLTERTDVWELPSKKQLPSDEKRQNTADTQKKEKMSFREFERSLIVLSVIGFKKGSTQQRLSLLFEYLKQKTKMDFVSQIQSPENQLAQLIGRDGVQTLKAKLNNAVLSQQKSPPNSNRKPTQGEKATRKHKSHMNDQSLMGEGGNKPQNSTISGISPRINYSFQIAPGEYKRDESPDTSYLSVKDASRGFQISHRQPVNMSISPEHTRVDQINMMLIQNLKKKSKHHITQNNSLDLVSLDPERVNRSYQVEGVSGKHSGLASPSERAKLSKKLRSLGGGSQSVTGRADSSLNKSSKKKHSKTRHNPRLAQIAGHIGMAPNSERTSCKDVNNIESLPPIMNPLSEGQQSSTPLQERNNSIIAATYENLANRSDLKGRDTPDSSSLRKSGLKAAHLEQYINESKHRSLKTYSNPYDTSQRAARSMSNSQRSNTLTLGYQFQKRIESKLNKSKTFKRKAFMTDTNTDHSSVPKGREQTTSQSLTAKKPIGRMILSTGQTPEPLGHLSLESTRSWRSERLNKLSPRDSSVESSRLSVHSINLAPFNLRTVNPHPPALPQPSSSVDPKGLGKVRDGIEPIQMSARASLRKQRDILKLSESIELEESSIGTPQQQNIIAKYQKRIKVAEMRANEYKRKLERARQILKAFQKKMKEVEEAHKQREQKKTQKEEEGSRPYSASNIYHNITIYANNSVNNNNISINSGSQSELEEKKSQESKDTQELRQLLATREAKLKEITKKLEASKRNEEKLMKQILTLNKRKQDTESLQ